MKIKASSSKREVRWGLKVNYRDVDGWLQHGDFKLIFWLTSAETLEFASPCCGAAPDQRQNEAGELFHTCYACAKVIAHVPVKRVIRRGEAKAEVFEEWLSDRFDPLTACLVASELAAFMDKSQDELALYYRAKPTSPSKEEASWAQAVAKVEVLNSNATPFVLPPPSLNACPAAD